MLGITAITQYSGGFACSAGPALVCLYMNNEDTYRKIMEIRVRAFIFKIQSSRTSL